MSEDLRIQRLAEKHRDNPDEVRWMLADIDAVATDSRLAGFSTEHLFSAWVAYSESVFAGWIELGERNIPKLAEWAGLVAK